MIVIDELEKFFRCRKDFCLKSSFESPDSVLGDMKLVSYNHYGFKLKILEEIKYINSLKVPNNFEIYRLKSLNRIINKKVE